MAQKKFCLLFAGVPGCSKTPTAIYLSLKFSLPVFNNDAIRTEVKEDKGFFHEEEFLKRRNERLKEALEKGNSFILDASVDRRWQEVKEKLLFYGYDYCLISFNLGKDFLIQLYKAKKYADFFKDLDKLFADHENFLQYYQGDVYLNLTETDFPQRLTLAYQAVGRFLKEKQ